MLMCFPGDLGHRQLDVLASLVWANMIIFRGDDGYCDYNSQIVYKPPLFLELLVHIDCGHLVVLPADHSLEENTEVNDHEDPGQN